MTTEVTVEAASETVTVANSVAVIVSVTADEIVRTFSWPTLNVGRRTVEARNGDCEERQGQLRSSKETGRDDVPVASARGEAEASSATDEVMTTLMRGV